MSFIDNIKNIFKRQVNNMDSTMQVYDISQQIENCSYSTELPSELINAQNFTVTFENGQLYIKVNDSNNKYKLTNDLLKHILKYNPKIKIDVKGVPRGYYWGLYKFQYKKCHILSNKYTQHLSVFMEDV